MMCLESLYLNPDANANADAEFSKLFFLTQLLGVMVSIEVLS